MNKYVSIDIKTTGLDEDTCQVLSVGAVIDDWKSPVEELPMFHCYVDNNPIVGAAYALSMHPKILRAIATDETEVPIYAPGEVTAAFRNWLTRYRHLYQASIVPAGKNFGSFDRQFLKRLPNWNIPMKHRSINPGNLYFDPIVDDGPPDTETCMARAGILGEVAHTALEDAVIVVRLIRYWAAHRQMMPARIAQTESMRADGRVSDEYGEST